MSNILQAIKLLIESPIVDIKDFNSSTNRANSVGESLENYVKNVFADSFGISESEQIVRFNKVFSYLGNQNNPPDIILRNGDGVEIKKVEKANTTLALNSSYPKAKLTLNKFLQKETSKNGEPPWTEKDILYIIGHTEKSKIKSLWFVYGDCFCADAGIYEKIKKTISSGITEIPSVEFTETKELGKVKKVDPLGITDLRIRGMWHIENPQRIFSYLYSTALNLKFQLVCLMKTEKFNSFPETDRVALQNIDIENYSIKAIKIKDPNNPANLLDCTLITFKVN